jgi:hypothetical protein
LLILHFMERSEIYVTKFMVPSYGFKLYWFGSNQTSWSLLGPGVEVGLVPNIMKGINIFIANVIKDFSYNYKKIQVLWKKGNKKKKSLLWKCLKWCHMALWNFRLCFEPSCLPPLKRRVN